MTEKLIFMLLTNDILLLQLIKKPKSYKQIENTNFSFPEVGQKIDEKL